MTRVYRLALATVAATLAIVLFGSVARLVPAGSGCGNDWPRCNGSWLPPLAWSSLVEYGHRLSALAVLGLASATAVAAFRANDASSRVRVFSALSVGMILVQSGIGAFSARLGAPAAVATLHLTVAMVFLASAVLSLAAAASSRGAPAWLAEIGNGSSPNADRTFALVATGGAVAAFVLVLFGASTSATGAFACATFPLCGDVDGSGGIQVGYRATALLGALAAVAVLTTARRRGASSAAQGLATAAVALIVVQTALNAVAAMLGNPSWSSAPHLPVAALYWVSMLSVAAVAWGSSVPSGAFSATNGGLVASGGGGVQRIAPAALAIDVGAVSLPMPALSPSLAPLRRIPAVVADYVALTKPGIMSLLLTTTFCAMLMAERGVPPFWLVAVTLLGGVLASGGANVLNCFIDRDIDGEMSRTRNRPTAAGRISPGAALTFGITLTVGAVLLLGLAVNWVAAMLALAGNLFYVFVYTLWLKRSTPYNIVIGGAAGSVPPLVGWAAVTGDLSPLAWGLFAIIFAWTPPHFWALALLKQGEYTRAAVPMLPVVRGEAETRRQIVLYTVVLTLVCIALTPLGLGAIYLGAALVLNGLFLAFALRLYREPSKRLARQTFFYSLWYLAFLFAAAVLDRIVLA